jgi:hypothetical protein
MFDHQNKNEAIVENESLKIADNKNNENSNKQYTSSSP